MTDFVSLLHTYGKNKWNKQNLRKKIEKNREIGVYFRKKKNITRKHKLQKRQRSKRRNLFDNEMSHIMENIDDYSDLFQNHNVTNYSYEQYQVCDYELTEFSHISFEREKAIYFCIVCNQFKISSNWHIGKCKECKKYLCQQTKNNLEKYRICEACFPKIDLCTTYKGVFQQTVSAFCIKLAEARCSSEGCYAQAPVMLERINKILEPTKVKISSDVCAYEVISPKKALKSVTHSAKPIRMNNKTYVAYCKKCVNSVTYYYSLKTCQYRGCNNRDFASICLNHCCHVCGSYRSDSLFDYEDSEKCLRPCTSCGQCYCVDFYHGTSCSSSTYSSNCGSIKYNKCKQCYLKEEDDDLKMAICENTPFYDEIALILFEYARGFMFQCGNYAHCEQMICLQSMFHAEQQFDMGSIYPGDLCDGYVVTDEKSIKKNQKYLTKIGDSYWRIICNECKRVKENEINECEIKIKKWWSSCGSKCGTEDMGIISVKSGDARYVCLKHGDEDVVDIPKCDNCSMSKPTIAWFNAGLSECRLCKMQLCEKCAGDGHHCQRE